MLKIAVVQTNPKLIQKDFNLNVIEEKLKKLSADLVIFPELANSGYNFKSKKEAMSCAEDAKTGPTAKMLQYWAKKKNTAYVLGLPEENKGRLYNSAVIVMPKSIHRYRKLHLFYNEKKYFTPGNKPLKVYKWKGVKFGVMICFDWLFPEVSRTLTLKGAQLIVHPSNLVMPYAPAGMKTRSLENHVFTATCNRVGYERDLKYIGQSQILGIKGETLVSLGKKEAVGMAFINPKLADIKKITPVNDVLTDRRVKFF